MPNARKPKTKVIRAFGGGVRKRPVKRSPVTANEIVKATAILPVTLPPAFVATQFQPGNVSVPKEGKRLMTRVREIMRMRSLRDDATEQQTRFDDAADAFARQMEAGNFPFFKEYVEREEGKVANVVQIEANQKMYTNMPLEGDDAP